MTGFKTTQTGENRGNNATRLLAAATALVLMAATPLTAYCANPDLASTPELPAAELGPGSLQATVLQQGNLNAGHVKPKGAYETATINMVGGNKDHGITQQGTKTLALPPHHGKGREDLIAHSAK